MIKVSVVMPVYNGERFLKESVQSILSQTFQDFELIIVNDGSTDGTKEILDGFKDKRVKIINNPKNYGVAKSLNIGLKEAKGEYIARADADDVNEKDRFIKEVRFLDEYLDYILVGAQAELVDNQNKKVGSSDLPLSDQAIRKKIFIRNPILHPTVMFRREALKRVGHYTEELNGAEDYDLWFRLVKVGKMANLPDALIKRRFDKDVITQRKHLKIEVLALVVRLLNLPFYFSI